MVILMKIARKVERNSTSIIQRFIKENTSKKYIKFQKCRGGWKKQTQYGTGEFLLDDL
jgi:hypothetical protein